MNVKRNCWSQQTEETTLHPFTTEMTSMRRNNQDVSDPETGKLLEVPTSPSSTVDEDESQPPPESPQFDKHPMSPRYSPLKAICACVLYCFCSVSMVLVNKSLASSYNHLIDKGNLNFLLVVFQAVVAVIAVEFSKAMGWVEYPAFDLKTARQWAPVNIAFCAMLFTGMASFQHNSVPLVTVFKNITNIFTAVGDFTCFGTKVEPLVMAAFGIMLGGAVFAAQNDLSATFVGLFWMLANCISTSGYILYMKHATKTVKLSKFGMVFYNNVLCTLFLLPVTLCNGEMKAFLATKAIHTNEYFLKNSFAGFVGFFLNFASLNCVALTGPTTYALVGSLNKIPTAILGWLVFNIEITPQTWFFIGVGMSGGFLFSYAKVKSSRKK